MLPVAGTCGPFFSSIQRRSASTKFRHRQSRRDAPRPLGFRPGRRGFPALIRSSAHTSARTRPRNLVCPPNGIRSMLPAWPIAVAVASPFPPVQCSARAAARPSLPVPATERHPNRTACPTARLATRPWQAPICRAHPMGQLRQAQVQPPGDTRLLPVPTATHNREHMATHNRAVPATPSPARPVTLNLDPLATVRREPEAMGVPRAPRPFRSTTGRWSNAIR